MSVDLLYSTEESDLRDSVRALLRDRCRPETVLAVAESEPGSDRELWRVLAAELGATSLQVPEAYGGQGATLREVAVVAEELGRAVAPVPFLGSAVLATSVALAVAEAPSCAALLGRLAAGQDAAAVAVPASAGTGSGFPDTVAEGQGGLSGTVRTVAEAAGAGTLIVPARAADGPGLYLVDAAAAGVTVDPVTSFDLTRPVADVTLDGANGERIAGPGRAEPVLDEALRVAAGILASEQLGLAEWCLESTVDYLKQRYQFGRPVGSYQALKHRLADLWYELVLARAAVRYAATTLASGDPDAAVAVHTARSVCSTAAVAAAEECVQLHGGIGMTWEHPAHLYLKRAKADEITLGTPAWHRASLGSLVELHPQS